ncbi:UBX domain-containing protein 4 isoform X2 [Echeneis naucrates]|uniref:UBX domain-containing protein 4 isoform X2 n=1 Tax=Echeneis naucrates TaxID=173247 RepID=UPI001113A5CA|nr:UBX domain-containing protein 4 isoform X2 [Echeneis naucrates]XP_029386743.1 UBX domain-containing protein 4 isoform X2 [Echeneis naucrates]
MRWFEGSIPNAITSAKERSFVFVVVITGEDEQSAQLMSSWEDDQVSEAALNCCVAIRVDAKSETCMQFSQIYPVVCIPSSFFIGENGTPLEVIAGSVSAEELKKRINRVKQMHAQQIGGVTVAPEGNPPLVNSPHNRTEPVIASAPEPAEDSAPVVPIKSAAELTMPTAVPESERASLSSPADGDCPSAAQYSPREENLDAKVERLTKKLEERREQKKKGEEENEIRKEMERRKVGKDMQDFKKKQEEERTKRLLEERNREKAEERAARERVKQQIAMDRADRAARYAKTQEEERAGKEALLQSRQADQDARREALARERSAIARIQFRLPDGSSFSNHFPSQSRLQEARLFVVQEVGNRYGNFSLATMFPRREFTNEDMDKTLLELELAPSASIVLLPNSGRTADAVVQLSEGGIWAILGTLLYPLLAVWRFLSSFLFPAPSPSGAASPPPPKQSSSSSSASEKTKRETLSKNTVEKRPKHFKKEGKICRLRTQEDNEDDNNTWNGNSTQQM